MRLKLFIDSDNIIEVTKLRHPVTKAYINNATIVGEVRAANDVTVISSGIAFTYLDDDEGGYTGAAPADDMDLTENAYYYVRLTVTSDEGETLFRERCKAQFYTGC